MRVLALILLAAVPAAAQFTQQGSRLRALDATGAAVGTAVAVSSDGTTAIAGGPTDTFFGGAAWIFTRNGTVWSQQGLKLIGSETAGDSAQGSSVAISADGNTVIFGGPRDRDPNDGTFRGAAWVFTRVAGSWSQQGTKLVGTGAAGAAQQGFSVGLSADGNTAIVGGPSDNGGAGAAWIFTRSGDTWTQQGSRLVGFTLSGASSQGHAVALSGDGNTAIVGGPGGADGGGAWIFTRTDGVWSQQGLQFVAIGGASQPGIPVRFGTAVALSHDGDTAIVGGPGDTSEQGAAWIFVRSPADEWAYEGKLVGSTENPGGKQGTSVSISADGDTAVSGGPLDHPAGAVWVFSRDHLGAWTQQGAKLVGGGASTFGSPQHGRSVDISADATTIVEAGSGDGAAGAVWPFAKAVPTIATLSGNLQSARTDSAFAPLTAIVRDAADQPSPNVPVTFAVHAGPSGAGGTFASSATVPTNGDGIAAAPALTANAAIGGFTVTATTPSAPATATFDLANAAMAAPANVVATGTAIPTVDVTWSPVSGATSYEVMRASNGVNYTAVAVTSAPSFTDSAQVFANSRFLYKVRVLEPALSGFSAPDLATTTLFTDPLLDGVHVKALHFTELRQAVHNVRAAAGLDDYPYTDPHLAGEPVKAAHLTELRAALDEARARILLPALLYTQPAIAAGSTVIAKSHVLDLRSGVQ